MREQKRSFLSRFSPFVVAVLALLLVGGCVPKAKPDLPSLPNPEATVPDLTAMTPEQAAEALVQNSLVLGRVLTTADSAWADLVKPGLIVTQSETRGARLPRHSTVDVVVYKPTIREIGEVPDVLGMPYDEAVAALEKAGFLPGEISRRFVQDQRLHDIVYRQSPEPGTRAKRWSKVNLGLYGPTDGDYVRVPRLTGLKATEVPAVLATCGLVQGEVTYVAAPAASLVGTVRAQSPGIGRKVEPGTKVDITVYSQ
jgi:beta-lactam-binding protein with PASTA domain